ncbi:hypothetical protein CD500_003501 [Salmonella enterica]|nr:hypothetical protein [Salmonella enterica]
MQAEFAFSRHQSKEYNRGGEGAYKSIEKKTKLKEPSNFSTEQNADFAGQINKNKGMNF